MNNTIKQTAIKYGTSLALVNLSYLLYAYLVDQSVFALTWPGILLFFCGLGFGMFSVAKFKQANDGYASFKEAFSAYMLTSIVAIFIGTVFTIMLFSLIDPEFAAGIMDMILEKTLEKFESSVMNDEQIEMIISRIEDSNPFGAMGQLKSATFSIMFNAILGLIVAAGMKKNKLEF